MLDRSFPTIHKINKVKTGGQIQKDRPPFTIQKDRPPFIWIEEISDSLIWTGAVGLDCIAAPPKNDVYNEARYIFLLLCQAFL